MYFLCFNYFYPVKKIIKFNNNNIVNSILSIYNNSIIYNGDIVSTFVEFPANLSLANVKGLRHVDKNKMINKYITKYVFLNYLFFQKYLIPLMIINYIYLVLESTHGF